MLGETIRIFRRSRSGRPQSATSSEAHEEEHCEQDEVLSTKAEEALPAPDTPAAAHEASSK